MTIVIMVLLALISTGLFVSRKMDEWKLGRQASETLRSVYSAQRMYPGGQSHGFRQRPHEHRAHPLPAERRDHHANRQIADRHQPEHSGQRLSPRHQRRIRESPMTRPAAARTPYGMSGNDRLDSPWRSASRFASAAVADEFKHVGDFLLQSHFKLTGRQDHSHSDETHRLPRLHRRRAHQGVGGG